MPRLTDITTIVDYMPPGHPVTSNTYWTSKLNAAEGYVIGWTGRQLVSASYTDVGHTIKVKPDSGSTQHIFYLSEPKGSAFTFAQLSSFTLNDVTVVTADVRVEADRLVFDGPGEVLVTYTGGYLADATAKSIILGAVAEVMLILHRFTGGGNAASSEGGAGGSVSYRSLDSALAQVREILTPYCRNLTQLPFEEDLA